MISVIIPAHNEEKHIEKTLKNIPNNLEIIIVCNGCEDNTVKISKKYGKTFIIEEKNVSLARNYGASKSRGNVIIFLDADTLINNEVIEKIKKIKDKYFFGTCWAKPDNNKFIANFYFNIKNLFGLFGMHNASGIIFCNKNLFKKIKFNENMTKHENQDFSKRAKKYGKRYFLNCYIITSMRRFEKIGYIKVPLYWLKEIFFKTRDYPVIR